MNSAPLSYTKNDNDMKATTEQRIEKLKAEILNLQYDRIAQIEATGYWAGHGSRMIASRRKQIAKLEATK